MTRFPFIPAVRWGGEEEHGEERTPEVRVATLAMLVACGSGGGSGDLEAPTDVSADLSLISDLAVHLTC
jgi:hypothetical protein